MGIVEGTVVHPERHDFTVDLVILKSDSDQEIEFTAVPDHNGNFRILDVPEGGYNVSISSVKQHLTVVAGAISTPTLGTP